MKRLAIALLVAFSATSSFANSNCDKPRNNFDGLYCLNKVYGEADKELNANYGALVKMIDTDGRAKLKSSQLQWIRTRDANCSRTEGASFFVNLECLNTMTVERAEFLQSRIRECKSAGCQNSKL